MNLIKKRKIVKKKRKSKNKIYTSVGNYFIYKRVEIKMFKVFIFTFFVSWSFAEIGDSQSFDKFLWITADSMKDKESISEALYFAFDHNFNKVFVQCRFRGDAVYKSNIVPRNLSIRNNNFDPLRYAVLIGHQLGLEVHAWMNTYILWSRSGQDDAAPYNLNHIYHTNKNWTESNIYGKSDSDVDITQVQSLNWEGIYLSPNHPEVNNYLLSVFKEVVDNYDIDGLHLDYIRFQSDVYGYNASGLKIFKEKYDFDPLDIERNIISTNYGWKKNEIDSMKTMWDNYKIQNINNLLVDIKKTIIESDKDISVSAAVKPDPNLAKDKWSQDWMQWLGSDFLDFVVLMNYASDNIGFYGPISSIKEKNNQDLEKIIMGISTFNQSSKQVSEKIYLSHLYGFQGISLFSYYTIDENQKENLIWFDPIIDVFINNIE